MESQTLKKEKGMRGFLHDLTALAATAVFVAAACYGAAVAEAMVLAWRAAQ